MLKNNEGNNTCGKCIKLYQEEKKKKELAKQQAALEAISKASSATEPPKPIILQNTIHCDCCTKSITSEIVYFEGENFHLECFACHSCKTKLKYQAVFREENGLACEKCKRHVKCK